MKDFLKHSNERGASLVMVLSLTLVLTLLGATVLNVMRSDLDLAGGDRASQSAFYLAESGVTFGFDALQNDHGFDGNTPDYNAVLNGTGAVSLTPVTNGMDLCTEVLFKMGPCTAWRLMTPEAGDGFPAGTDDRYWVFVRDDDDGDDDPTVDTNETLIMWSLGRNRDGARRLLEVVVTHNTI